MRTGNIINNNNQGRPPLAIISRFENHRSQKDLERILCLSPLWLIMNFGLLCRFSDLTASTSVVLQVLTYFLITEKHVHFSRILKFWLKSPMSEKSLLHPMVLWTFNCVHTSFIIPLASSYLWSSFQIGLFLPSIKMCPQQAKNGPKNGKLEVKPNKLQVDRTRWQSTQTLERKVKHSVSSSQ